LKQVAGQKRAKDIARAKYERQQARRLQQQRARRRNMFIAAGIGGVIVLGGIAIAFWPESTDTSTPTASSSRPPAPVPTPTGVSCSPADSGKTTAQYSKPDAMNLKPGSAMTLDTNCGQVTFSLDVAKAPKSTNALAFLASKGWYTNGNCPRLVVEGIFVVQCGSANGDGTGSPGFSVPDENTPKAVSGGTAQYPRGTVAMANSGPNTANSQFFIVYKDSVLAPNYSIVGQVTSGLDVIEYVASQGVAEGSKNPSDGQPNQPLVIKTATVRNGP
jgi:peptidyl-prolyl cis-trans isomerase B (cyclophilin B)